MLSPFLQKACNHWIVRVIVDIPSVAAAHGLNGGFFVNPWLRAQFVDAKAVLQQVLLPYDGAGSRPGMRWRHFSRFSQGRTTPSALRDGDLTTRLERCTGWVKAEASEAAFRDRIIRAPWQADACAGAATPGCSGIVEDDCRRLPSTISAPSTIPTRRSRVSRDAARGALLNQSPRSSSGCSGSSG